jgi:acyl-CoA synthetase (NDP forming)
MKKASSRALRAIALDSSNKENDLIHLESRKSAHSRLERLLRPRSIALVGASATPGSFGASVLLNLKNAGFSGPLYLINPKHPLIEGRPCLASVEELPEAVDCAVLAIPGSAVLETARACGRKKISSLIVFSAGFAESGESGKAAQRELEQIAREYDMVVEGPNCLGMVNYVDSIPLTFVATPPQERKNIPGVAIVSQSGALAAVVAVNMRHHDIALTYSISTGNEVSQGVEDFLEQLIGDKSSRVLALIVEQFRNPRRFLQSARSARESGQFIVLLHPGKSSAARRSAATHTGALAGNYEVMRTLVTHSGVILVETLEEFVDVSQLLARIRELPRKGAAVFTESGAFKAHALDQCESIGLDLPELSDVTERALAAALPAFIPPSNPLDLTAQGLVDPGLYRRTLPAVLGDPQFGSVVLGIILTDSQTMALKLPPILDAINTLRPSKPVIFAALDEGAPFDCESIRELRELGVPCFPSPERALRALARVTTLGRQLLGQSDDSPVRSTPPIDDGVLSEHRAKEFLKGFGIPVPQGGLAHTLDEATRIAFNIGFPVVMKAQAEDLPHKSDVGGVLLNIENARSLAEGWASLHRNIEAKRPGLELDGVLVERMGKKGVELIAGARNDSQWGPVLLIGSGGVLAEVLRDVRLIPAHLSVREIESELYSLKCSPLFRGFRGAQPLDVDAAVQILFTLGSVIRSHPEILEIDINPIAVYPKGAGAVALDALIVAGSDDSEPEKPKERHL